MDDTEFLILLVHRGELERSLGEELFGRVKAGECLNEILAREHGWDPARLARLRRTRCGEIPEIPGYQILGRLGAGGTADVFKARELSKRRIVALKVLKRSATVHEAMRRGFIAEARLLEQLDHPGIVRCHGVARCGETYFSTLEWIDGRTLLELLEGGRRFAEHEALDVVLQAAEALRYLEERHVVHRDVKPGNLMLAQDGRVVLIDLGFAAEGGSAAQAGQAVGTVAYLSPEQARGGAKADVRSDVYSLGLSLFHVAVGRLPFDSSDDREVLRMQVMDSLRSSELKARGLSVHLQYFIEKMVAKEAEHRYQGFSELIADVRAQLEGWKALDFEARAQAQRKKRGRRR
jgi:serine/threonine-protein kinase